MLKDKQLKKLWVDYLDKIMKVAYTIYGLSKEIRTVSEAYNKVFDSDRNMFVEFTLCTYTDSINVSIYFMCLGNIEVEVTFGEDGNPIRVSAITEKSMDYLRIHVDDLYNYPLKHNKKYNKETGEGFMYNRIKDNSYYINNNIELSEIYQDIAICKNILKNSREYFIDSIQNIIDLHHEYDRGSQQ